MRSRRLRSPPPIWAIVFVKAIFTTRRLPHRVFGKHRLWMRPPITATVIACNEEAKLPGCLETLYWADEIVVVDAGSTDRTQEIARSAGARVVHQPWLGFAAQKNRAADLATHDWVLNVDADERVGVDLERAIDTAAYDVAAYGVHRVSDFMGRQHRPVHRASREILVRLYDRRRAAFGDDLVHEKVVAGGPVAELPGTLYHEGYRGLDDFVVRLNRYSSLLAEQRAREPSSSVRLFARPFARLAWALFRHGLIRDGRRGFALAFLWAHHDLLVEAKRYEAQLGPAEAFPARLFASGAKRGSGKLGRAA
jgi:(heptosyl)LPS beta-1,4-glucosyltransferase